MTIRITGMNSGLDTDAIITELVSAYKAKGDKYVKSQTKLSWTQDLWKSLNTKIFNFYKSLDKLRLGTSVKKKTTVSDPAKATVTAGSNAVSGTQSLKIKNLATGGYITGDQLKKKDEDGKVSADDTLESLGYSGSGKITLKGLESVEGSKDLEIDVTSSTTIKDVIKQIKARILSWKETQRRSRVLVWIYRRMMPEGLKGKTLKSN